MPGTRTTAAYFLGGISAGRYREISKPAATWHMVGFVQLFFMAFSSSTSPKGPILFSVNHCWAPLQWLVHQLSKWTNETVGSEKSKNKTIEITMLMLQLPIT
ncbi:hypothetical protein [Mesorhizobium sp.]|uniref:hypothetical protein n=1 Tax=Mesorhizobium sp. TaxID=1871066 RepID=UPI0025ECACF4|nr:hypothetical protein [Mesorhizobium sp.]